MEGLFLRAVGFALTEPLCLFAAFAFAGVVLKASGDALGFGCVFVLEDEPVACHHGRRKRFSHLPK